MTFRFCAKHFFPGFLQRKKPFGEKLTKPKTLIKDKQAICIFMPQILLDRETFKALAGETRVQILKELNERRKTQSELATKLHLSAPTVNEHLSLLKKAGLVEEIDDGHKWKYFSLSRKGKNILNPSEVQIMLVLSILGVAFVAMLLLFFFSRDFGAGNLPFSSAAEKGLPALAADTAGKAVGAANSTACVPIAAAQLPVLEIGLLIAAALFIGLLAGYLLKNK